MSDALKFPSGRSVGNCRKDAKRLARQENIPLNAALDQVASANGIPHPWARALSLLDAQQTLPAPKRTNMDQLSYLAYAPVTYRIQAKYLEVGMLHVAQFELGSFEISRIRGIRAISEDSMQIDLGPEGHANRIVGPSQYVDVPVLPCPNCDEKKQLSTDLHVA